MATSETKNPGVPDPPQKNLVFPLVQQDAAPVAEPAPEPPPPPPKPEFKTVVQEAAASRLDGKVSPETLIAKYGDTLAFFPKTPYDIVTDKNGERFEVFPSLYIGTSEINRRKPQDVTSLFGMTEKLAIFAGKPQTLVKEGQLLLVPLPTRPNETVTFIPGMRVDATRQHPVIRVVNENGRVVVKPQDGTTQELPKEFSVITDEKRTDQKVFTSPPEKVGQVESSTVVVDEHILRASVKVVEVDGIKAMLIEGVAGMGVQVDQAIIDGMKKHYLSRANETQSYSRAALMSEVHPGHPLRNEDAGLRTPEGVTIIADGMGGYEGGYANSRLARAILAASVSSRLSQAKNPEQVMSVFSSALHDSHEIIKTVLKDQGDTTATLSYVMTDPKTHKKELVWATVGDSAIAVVRGDRVYHVSPDDNKLNELIRGHKLNTWTPLPNEFRTLKKHLEEVGLPIDMKNGEPYVFLWEQGIETLQRVLTSFEGFGQFRDQALLKYLFKVRKNTAGIKHGIVDENTDIHKGIFHLEPEDIIITASDGLWDPVADGRLLMAVKSGNGDPTKIAQAVMNAVKAANAQVDDYHQRDKEDDVTLLVEVVGR